MIEDMSAQAGNRPQDNFVWMVIAAGVSALVLALGLFVFASNVAYRENFHAWYLLAFFLGTAGLGASIGFRKLSVALLMAVLLAVILGVSIAKFGWQKNIRLVTDNPGAVTALGDYTRLMPTLEQHWNPYDSAPDWVKFDEECYRPALGQGSYAETCKDKNRIFSAYGIDVMQTIRDRYSVMKDTARRISTGELASKQAYMDCISGGSCAVVPLLPVGVDAAKLGPTNEDYKDVRIAFWNLIDGKEMTVDLCEYMPFCKAMTTTGAVTRTDFPG